MGQCQIYNPQREEGEASGGWDLAALTILLFVEGRRCTKSRPAVTPMFSACSLGLHADVPRLIASPSFR
jgi:hypothetical protein